KTDKQSWQFESCSGSLIITYSIYAWDLSVRTAHLDQTHGYFNGTSLFLEVVGQSDQPCSVEIIPPDRDYSSQWQVATTLPSLKAKSHQFGIYQAVNYDELIDHPVEMGSFTLIKFSAAGIPHEIAITGRHNCDEKRLIEDLTRICESQIEMFGEAPFERYLFQVMAAGSGYGGLEHRSSTSLLCNRDDLPHSGMEKVTTGYRQFLGLCSHEYFHSWNIKRIKPAAFIPYDLSQESHTSLLWFFEGITSYYDDLTLLRSGCIDRESYLELLGQTITRVERGAGRFKQTVSESSFDAWSKFYKQDENAPNAIVSYYAKGALIALALDLTIRSEGNRQKSLDDVKRELWQQHGKPLIGVNEEGLEELIEKVTGVDLKPFFDHALRTTKDLPIDRLLEQFGISLKKRTAASASDLGGKGSEKRLSTTLGIKYSSQTNGLKVTIVHDDSAAQKAGISVQDRIIALNSIEVTADNFEKLLERTGPEQEIILHLFRRDELMEITLVTQKAARSTCYLEVTDSSNKLLNSWLCDEQHG
ncbi:MAG: PDZ domain-containing protein, partial [Gammaproteobacteria bacterium]|nr:PDZ domain-containing protein [Gammaproteobacteria bacterium]